MGCVVCGVGWGVVGVVGGGWCVVCGVWCVVCSVVGGCGDNVVVWWVRV